MSVALPLRCGPQSNTLQISAVGTRPMGHSLRARERAAADDPPRPGGRRQRPLNGYTKIGAMLKGNAGEER